MAKVPVTVVIITKNEEKNIAECLKSVSGWATEIIVVDDESTDHTREIAQDWAALVMVRRMENEGRHRNWAYAQAKNDWVLSLDADERVTSELREEIGKLLTSEDKPEFSAYTIPRRNFIGDYWIRHGGQYPAPQLKLFLKARFRFEEVEVHPRVFLDGQNGHLRKDLIHYSYRDFEHFLAKLNGQTTLEAKKWVQTGRKMSLGKALWRTFDRFLRTFLRKKSYKDGFIGFMLAFFASLYQIMSYAKYWEMKKRLSGRPSVFPKNEENAAGSKKN